MCIRCSFIISEIEICGFLSAKPSKPKAPPVAFPACTHSDKIDHSTFRKMSSKPHESHKESTLFTEHRHLRRQKHTLTVAGLAAVRHLEHRFSKIEAVLIYRPPCRGEVNGNVSHAHRLDRISIMLRCLVELIGLSRGRRLAPSHLLLELIRLQCRTDRSLLLRLPPEFQTFTRISSEAAAD